LGRDHFEERRGAVLLRSQQEGWLKVKCSQRAKFPVVGFVKDPGGIAALYLGKQEGNELSYVGKVRTGWSRTVFADLRRKLNEAASPRSKLTKPVRKPKATWVEPSSMSMLSIICRARRRLRAH
jgi:bifunctional non-homologous end joining protein LigD